MDYYPLLQPMREFFTSGKTISFEFRKDQLLKLRDWINANSARIDQALYTDLHKSSAESWATETGLVLMEINLALKHLQSWMKPEKVSTNAVNLPSSSVIHKDPLGTVLIIAPWNYPFQLLILPLVGAIAAGNCVVLKPSELAPATTSLVSSMIDELFPPGYVRVIEGDGAVVIPPMMDSFRFDHVFYTGSIPVGKIIYQQAAKELIPVTLELGGKSPAIVEADAKLDVAARRITLGKFLNAGQTCIAPDYVLVHESRKDAFINQLKKAIVAFYTSEPSTSGDYGRIINRKRFDSLSTYLQQGTVAFGGITSPDDLYFSPTILTDLPPGSAIMNEEIFGPILPVITFNRREEAVNIINANPNPLAFYLFTEDAELKKQWISSTSFGGGCINNTAWHFANHNLPFGGVGNSGIGSYHGENSFNIFSRRKPVMETPTWLDPAVKYPPYKNKLKMLKMFIGR
ncbi:MAG TPA: aldehyde dehydrogenase [Flavitalea sp.]|nr:aldehyde dehydrogenase [Flavitalea sp.]